MDTTMKKIYMTPMAVAVDMETTYALTASQPPAEIDYPGIEDSRELSEDYLLFEE